ncbi:peroxiredoxin family protein [Mesobacillus subterraneus]|nr:peroxiredoxin family protein [Mesobacillus subterraneus]MCM3685281.1 peroxiredoxin family protein [Mesobacillus subterraneus]
MQNRKELFSQFPGNVYAVSNSSVDEHKALKEELGLEYPVISDKDMKLIRKVKMLDPEAPKAVRGFAVLDKDGKVLHSQELDPFGLEAEGIIPYAADIAAGKQPTE